MIERKRKTEEEKRMASLKAVKKYRRTEKGKIAVKKSNDNYKNTFGRVGKKRGNSGLTKRDYELTEEQLKRRNKNREKSNYMNVSKQYSVLIWYDEKLDHLSSREYDKIYDREYARQWSCAVRGYVGRTKPSEHFLFDFDLEQMLKGNVYVVSGGNRIYI